MKLHLVTKIISSGIDDGIDLNGKASLQTNLNGDSEEKQKLNQEYREELAKVIFVDSLLSNAFI